MDYTTAALTYGLLLLPAMFSLAVMGQGVYKIQKGDESGKIIFGFGVFFLLLIPAAYFFLIRV
jgi:hypothetical protein